MKDIIIKVPDSFTQEQIDFIKNSAVNQIEAELKSTLKIPQEAIDVVETQVEALKVAMDIAKVEAEPVAEI